MKNQQKKSRSWSTVHRPRKNRRIPSAVPLHYRVESAVHPLKVVASLMCKGINPLHRSSLAALRWIISLPWKRWFSAACAVIARLFIAADIPGKIRRALPIIRLSLRTLHRYLAQIDLHRSLDAMKRIRWQQAAAAVRAFDPRLVRVEHPTRYRARMHLLSIFFAGLLIAAAAALLAGTVHPMG